MGIEMQRLDSHKQLFNSPVETGARISLLLFYLAEKKLDLDQLVFFDFVITYSSDFSGPESLHPKVPNHLAEFLHRRNTIPSALRLFISKGLLETSITESGVLYSSTSNTSQFVSCLKSNYYRKLWEVLSWIEGSYDELETRRATFLRDCRGFRCS